MDDQEQLNYILMQISNKDKQARALAQENNNLKVRITELELVVKKYKGVESKINDYDFMILRLQKELSEAKEKGGSNCQREMVLLQNELTEVLRREEEKREILYNELMRYSTGLKKMQLKYRDDTEALQTRIQEECIAKQDVTADNGLLKEDLEKFRKENAELQKAKKLSMNNLEKELEDMRFEKMQITVSRDKAERTIRDMKIKYLELEKKYNLVNEELKAKYAELDDELERTYEHKTRLYEHCFKLRKEYKILYRDFMKLKKDLKKKEEEICKLKAAIENGKIRGNSKEELPMLFDENASSEQTRAAMKEEIEHEFWEQISNLEGQLSFAEKGLRLANEKICRLENAKFQAEKKIAELNSEIESLKEYQHYQVNSQSPLDDHHDIESDIESVEEYQVNPQSPLVDTRDEINNLENAREETENKHEEIDREIVLKDEPAAHEPDFSFEFDDNSASDGREEISKKVDFLIANDRFLNDVIEFKSIADNSGIIQTRNVVETADQMTQTEPASSETQSIDIGVSTDPDVSTEPDVSMAPASLQPNKVHPKAEWVQENNVTKLLLTFAGNANQQIQICNSDQAIGVAKTGSKRKQEYCDENGRKSLRLRDNESVNVSENNAEQSSTAEDNFDIETPSTSKRSDVVMSASPRNERNISPITEKRPEDAIKQKFSDLLNKMRSLENKLVENMALENYQSQLLEGMLSLLRIGDDTFLTHKVMEFLLSRKTDISLSLKKHDSFANVEKCIASCYAKFVLIGRSKIVDDFLRLFLDVIKQKEKYHMSGYASACLVYAMICETASHHTNARTLCYKLMMHHKEYSVFLIACVYRVYPDARDYSDKKTLRFWLERVIMHVLSRKPRAISDQKWKEILGVFKEDPSFLDKSGESPEHLLEEIMSDIRKYKKARYEDLREDFGHALMLLATYYGKKWTNNVLKRQIDHLKVGQTSKVKHKNILHLFEMVERKSQSFFNEVNACLA